MHNITKHYTEEEWEGNNSWNSRVKLLVVWSAIGIDHVLERPDEIVSLERCWFYQLHSIRVQFLEVQSFEIFLGSKIIQFKIEIERSWAPRESSSNA